MLRSHLHDALGIALRLDHPHAFVDVVAGGFLAIDILAGFHCPDRRERVPVVWSSNGNRLDLGVGEHLPHIFEFRGFIQVLPRECRLGPFACGLVDVAYSHDLSLGQTAISIKMIAAAASEAYDAYVDLVICAPDTSRRRSGERAEKESPSFQIRHQKTPFSR